MLNCMNDLLTLQCTWACSLSSPLQRCVPESQSILEGDNGDTQLWLGLVPSLQVWEKSNQITVRNKSVNMKTWLMGSTIYVWQLYLLCQWRALVSLYPSSQTKIEELLLFKFDELHFTVNKYNSFSDLTTATPAWTHLLQVSRKLRS